MSNFHIGEEAVLLIDGDKLKKGSVVEIRAAQNCTCNCGGVLYDVGDYRDWFNTSGFCTVCGTAETFPRTNKIWFHQTELSKLQTKSEEEDMNEAIEEALSQPAFQ